MEITPSLKTEKIDNRPTTFKKGNPGKPKGAISKQTEFKNFIFTNFNKNKAKAEAMVNEMYSNKKDFKWLMNLIAGLCPRELEHSGIPEGKERDVIIVYANRPSNTSNTERMLSAT